ncbi:unnamed protein product [Closterium sp. NIES-64]|nr:unnamed protein product [Closterium sp. NIES-64]
MLSVFVAFPCLLAFRHSLFPNFPPTVRPLFAPINPPLSLCPSQNVSHPPSPPPPPPPPPPSSFTSPASPLYSPSSLTLPPLFPPLSPVPSWHEAKALPGAHRLLSHLTAGHVPVALASSSPRGIIATKLALQPGWQELFAVTVAGEEVAQGKPAPDIFLRAAKLMGAKPSECLVFEDAPAGVQAARAAGMYVIAVPSLPQKAARALYSSAHQILASLLDFQPADWGLPPFTDWVHASLPIDPWYMKGPVIKGYGRGSKLLGIPTANLPSSSFAGHLAEHTCGIYHGWAALPGRGVFKMVMSVGWNPFFNNTHKTVEPWLLHDFGEDFYGEELRLLVVGYIRAEADFPDLPSLIARIHRDGEIARKALDHPPFAVYKTDPFLNLP